MTPLLAGLCFIGLGLLSFALARNVVATNSYESMKRHSRRVMGVICLLIGGVGIVGGINELLKPAPTVHKAVKRRKAKPRAETQPTEEELVQTADGFRQAGGLTFQSSYAVIHVPLPLLS